MSENAEETINCFACHKDTGIALASKVSRTEECPYCFASLHSCKMCKFYDSSAYNECHESQAARIIEKDKSNFCDFFILSGVGETPSAAKDKLLSAADSIFKN